ncbi:MAG TPA: hypothetical protein VFG11_04365 [Acidobacteriota bacterium]|nr:hypothetical protein [Acidobacteriota bacterium]
MIARMGMRVSARIVLAIFFLLGVLTAIAHADKARPACWFAREQNTNAPRIAVPTDVRSVKLSGYFRVFYSPSDPLFRDRDNDGMPEILSRNQAAFTQSRHVLETVLGWKLPASRSEMSAPELDVYFVAAPDMFGGTTRLDPALQIILNEKALGAHDFGIALAHQLAHAAELGYRLSGEYWIYEATAGWLENQVQGYSAATLNAQSERLSHPELPLTSADPVAALGASRFIDVLSRPYPDVIRQIWDQWSQATTESLMDVIRRVLVLNHLPGLDSYLQGYFLLSSPVKNLDADKTHLMLQPYSAAAYRGSQDHISGGALLTFTPDGSTPYSANVIAYMDEKSGSLAMKIGASEPWSVSVPFAGLDHYTLVIINTSGQAMRGEVRVSFDPTIPAVLEYFHASHQEDGVRVEWKTARENGVAFWNLYRMQNGRKYQVNSYPIPATVNSEEGIHYLFLDSTAGALYWLEAVTDQGLPSALGRAETTP